MTEEDTTRKKARRDLLLVLLILPFGVLCMFMAGQAAIILAPKWMLNADMRSLLDPNAEFAAGGLPFFLEPLNPGILTPPAWGDFFLTPRAIIPTRVILTSTPPPPVNTPAPPPVLVTPNPPVQATATVGGPIIIPTRGGSPESDLRIEKSDNSSTYTPGTGITYTILVTNLGPDDAPSFDVTDTVPAVISGLTVNCAPAARCGTNTSSGNTVSFSGASLPQLGVNQIKITISGTVVTGATGNLVNTANVVVPAGVRVRDPNPANDIVTDTDTQLSVYDLAITKSDGVSTYTTTVPINYTIVVTNSGPSDALGVSVTDNRPPQIASWSWTCVSVINASECNGATNSTNNFTDTVNLQPGGRIEYSVSANPAGIAQNVSNTANIKFPSGPNQIDPNMANNSATDVDIPYIDIQVTKDDGGAAFTPNGTVPYIVRVTNNSTFNLTGITVSDLKPTQISSWSWVCTTVFNAGACNGVTGSTTTFNDTVNIQSGGWIEYSVAATIAATAGLGDITNTATVNTPVGLVDANPANNSATDITPPLVDLQITKDDGLLIYTLGGTVSYTVIVTNNSGFDLNGVTVMDNIPALIDTWTWVCTPGPGASCTPGPSSANINDTAVSLPAGAFVTYTINATVSGTGTGDLSNTATVTPPLGLIDTDLSDNTATDTDILIIGTTPDNIYYSLPSGGTLTLNIPTVVNGHAGPDLVYYEYLNINDGELYLDWIQVQVGDGTNWYTVFYWGDEIADTNSNMNFNVLLPPTLSPPPPPNEPDQRHIQAADLGSYPPSGITIDLDGYIPSLDGFVPPGNYPYLRFIAPPGDVDGMLEIDAVLPLP